MTHLAKIPPPRPPTRAFFGLAMCGALGLTLALTPQAGAASPTLQSAPSAEGPTRGSDIAAAVQRALGAQGLTGDPQIGAGRMFPPCAQALEVSAYGSAGWATAEVRCPAPKPWQVLVRTMAQGAASSAQKATTPPPGAANTSPLPGHIVVLTTSLRPGEVITPEAVTLAPSRLDPGSGLFSDPQMVIGRRMLTGLGEGRPLRSRHVDLPWLLTEGAPVMIVKTAGAIEIAAPGIVVSDAQEGDLVQVRNAGSGQIITAVALSKEKVRPVANIPAR